MGDKQECCLRWCRRGPRRTPAMPRVHGRRATATNVKRCRTRSCSRRSVVVASSLRGAVDVPRWPAATSVVYVLRQRRVSRPLTRSRRIDPTAHVDHMRTTSIPSNHGRLHNPPAHKSPTQSSVCVLQPESKRSFRWREPRWPNPCVRLMAMHACAAALRALVVWGLRCRLGREAAGPRVRSAGSYAACSGCGPASIGTRPHSRAACAR
jgi:hypothetical protein